MARPEKTGLAYFNVETDIFHNRKVRRLLKNYGASGFLIYTYVLTEIYRDKGHFIEWDEDTAFDVADSLRVKETLVNDVVLYCCSVNLFNKELLKNEGVITNLRIQKFWKRVVKAAGRKSTSINPNINLLKKPINQESTPKPEESTPKHQESTQSKVKKSKVKKTITERESHFKTQVFSHSNFSNKVLEAFFNYWTEKNLEGTLMKFEAQDFFNVETRLKKWGENEKKWSPKKEKARENECENLKTDSLEEKFKNYDS
ncbi:DUF4373 domain-containing protein [Tenacibaculum maritimum]|uniref:DUF4373 domain-containing protein n=1 Tax=Tenacibaculum maritimum TaxID=107401 RepID=UPI0012E66725|nr:DUF4373 domain-containing protein [Tenacibaculum maritimum]CAA0230195.1 hypothetical protein TMP139_50008 [Tenacibaculum maritimum]CAA0250073.1 hypothetical protein TMP445_760088 [Tenacibaculum maritimum]